MFSGKTLRVNKCVTFSAATAEPHRIFNFYRIGRKVGCNISLKPKLVFKYPKVTHFFSSWNNYRIVDDAKQTLILNQVQITNIN